MVPLRSHAKVRSSFFQSLIAQDWGGDFEGMAASEFRPLWKRANAIAHEWRRQATNRYNHKTKRWSDGEPSYRRDAGRGNLLGW